MSELVVGGSPDYGLSAELEARRQDYLQNRNLSTGEVRNLYNDMVAELRTGYDRAFTAVAAPAAAVMTEPAPAGDAMAAVDQVSEPAPVWVASYGGDSPGTSPTAEETKKGFNPLITAILGAGLFLL